MLFFLVEFSRKEIFVKNSLSLHAISWESVITEPSIFNWSGNNFEDLCVLFCTDLICCHNNFVSLLSVTDAVKWLLFAFLIRDFVKFLYFLYSAQFRSFFYSYLYICVLVQCQDYTMGSFAWF